MKYDEKGEILKSLETRSSEIKEPRFIQKTFEKMTEEAEVDRYVQYMPGHVPSDEELGEKLIPLFHFAECDVHHECLVAGLRAKGKLGRFGEFTKDKKQ